MTARAAVHTILATDAALSTAGTLGALGVQAVYASGDADNPPQTEGYCWLVHRWGTTGSAFGTVAGTSRLLIYAHDRNRDYGRISDVLARVKQLLNDATQVAGADGWTLTEASWTDDSDDLFDPAVGSVYRRAGFTAVSRRTA